MYKNQECIVNMGSYCQIAAKREQNRAVISLYSFNGTINNSLRGNATFSKGRHTHST